MTRAVARSSRELSLVPVETPGGGTGRAPSAPPCQREERGGEKRLLSHDPSPRDCPSPPSRHRRRRRGSGKSFRRSGRARRSRSRFSPAPRCAREPSPAQPRQVRTAGREGGWEGERGAPAQHRRTPHRVAMSSESGGTTPGTARAPTGLSPRRRALVPASVLLSVRLGAPGKGSAFGYLRARCCSGRYAPTPGDWHRPDLGSLGASPVDAPT